MRSSLGRLVNALRAAFGLVRSSDPSALRIVIGLALASSLLTGVELTLVKRIVDALSAERSALAAVVGFSVATALRRLVGVASTEAGWLIGERIDRVVSHRVLEVASTARFEEFESPQFQNALSRAIDAGNRQVWSTSDGLMRTLRASTTIVVLAGVLVQTAPSLLVPFAVAALCLGLIAMAKSRVNYSFAYHDTPADRERRYLREALVSRSEGREMRLFGTGGSILNRHDQLMASRLFELKKLLSFRVRADFFGAVGLAAVLAGCLGYIGWAVTNGRLEVGAAAIAAVAAHQLSGSLTGLSNGVGGVLEAARHVEDLQTFLDRPIPAVPELVIDTTDRIQRLKLDGVSFRYPGTERHALSNVSLNLEVGEVVAIVGANGSGKTTLSRLVLGLYQPTSGSVRAVGSKSTEVTGPLVGKATAMFQDFARYELPLIQNLSLGLTPPAEPDDATIRLALARAHLEKAVSDLNEGVNTRLGRKFDSGQDLSVGQWQRLALARAIMNRDAPFVVLDEPTAALDTATETAVIDGLRETFAGQGVLLVSHRLAGLHTVDRIVVLDDGKIAETGTHAQLVTLGGLYAAMYRHQAERFGG